MTALPLTLNERPLRLVAVTLALAVAASLTLTAEAAAPRGPGMAMDGPMMAGPGHMDRLLDDVGASPEQRSQIQAIMATARTDMRAQHEAGRSLRDQMMQLFTQPAVDARAVEALRLQMQARHDVSSKRMTQAMLEVSRVLSVEQRKQLGDKLNQRHALMERQRSEREALAKPVTR